MNKNKLPILIGCEESQTICKTFRDAGYESFSCDIKETRGNADWHYKDDIINVIQKNKWGLIILHPDCTAMAVSGNRWYGNNMPGNDERLKQIKWTIDLWELAKQHSDRVALENPVSVIFKHLRANYIQPWEFGHGETKKTGFALHNLPPLVPTNIVDGREQRVFKMPPSENRKRDRSKTYEGIAKAIVSQWGILLD
jgi:hypothetical protein